MDKIRQEVTFSLPAGEIARPGVPRGIRTEAIYGKELENTCIAQVDFLGFSALLKQAAGRAPQVVQDIYQQTELHARIGARTDGDDLDPTIAFFQYADTVNLVARDEGTHGIRPIVQAVAHLLASMHGRGLPARAGISMGELWAMSRNEHGGLDGDFVSGPALVAAHEIECVQEWSGGMVDPRCRAMIDSGECQTMIAEGWLVEYDVPAKMFFEGSTQKALAINWPRSLHVPSSEYLASVLRCDNPPNDDEASQWAKRRAACNFYDEYGAGRLPEHADDYVAWLVSPSGLHLPLTPAITLFV